MDEQVSFELLSYKSQRIAEVTNCKNEIANAQDEIEVAQEQLLECKRQFIKTMDDVQQQRERISLLDVTIAENAKMSEAEKLKKEKEYKPLMGRILSAFEQTPENEREKLQKKLKRLEADLLGYSAEIQGKKKHLVNRIALKDALLKKVSNSRSCDIS
jgi:hypothetical protein